MTPLKKNNNDHTETKLELTLTGSTEGIGEGPTEEKLIFTMPARSTEEIEEGSTNNMEGTGEGSEEEELILTVPAGSTEGIGEGPTNNMEGIGEGPTEEKLIFTMPARSTEEIEEGSTNNMEGTGEGSEEEELILTVPAGSTEGIGEGPTEEKLIFTMPARSTEEIEEGPTNNMEGTGEGSEEEELILTVPAGSTEEIEEGPREQSPITASNQSTNQYPCIQQTCDLFACGMLTTGVLAVIGAGALLASTFVCVGHLIIRNEEGSWPAYCNDDDYRNSVAAVFIISAAVLSVYASYQLGQWLNERNPSCGNDVVKCVNENTAKLCSPQAAKMAGIITSLIGFVLLAIKDNHGEDGENSKTAGILLIMTGFTLFARGLQGNNLPQKNDDEKNNEVKREEREQHSIHIHETTPNFAR